MSGRAVDATRRGRRGRPSRAWASSRVSATIATSVAVSSGVVQVGRHGEEDGLRRPRRRARRSGSAAGRRVLVGRDDLAPAVEQPDHDRASRDGRRVERARRPEQRNEVRVGASRCGRAGLRGRPATGRRAGSTRRRTARPPRGPLLSWWASRRAERQRGPRPRPRATPDRARGPGRGRLEPTGQRRRARWRASTASRPSGDASSAMRPGQLGHPQRRGGRPAGADAAGRRAASRARLRIAERRLVERVSGRDPPPPAQPARRASLRRLGAAPRRRQRGRLTASAARRERSSGPDQLGQHGVGSGDDAVVGQVVGQSGLAARARRRASPPGVARRGSAERRWSQRAQRCTAEHGPGAGRHPDDSGGVDRRQAEVGEGDRVRRAVRMVDAVHVHGGGVGARRTRCRRRPPTTGPAIRLGLVCHVDGARSRRRSGQALATTAGGTPAASDRWRVGCTSRTGRPGQSGGGLHRRAAPSRRGRTRRRTTASATQEVAVESTASASGPARRGGARASRATAGRSPARPAPPGRRTPAGPRARCGSGTSARSRSTSARPATTRSTSRARATSARGGAQREPPPASWSASRTRSDVRSICQRSGLVVATGRGRAGRPPSAPARPDGACEDSAAKVGRGRGAGRVDPAVGAEREAAATRARAGRRQAMPVIQGSSR